MLGTVLGPYLVSWVFTAAGQYMLLSYAMSYITMFMITSECVAPLSHCNSF